MILHVTVVHATVVHVTVVHATVVHATVVHATVVHATVVYVCACDTESTYDCNTVLRESCTTWHQNVGWLH